MSDYEAYRINAFGDEQVADQVDRRWKNARVNGREADNLATDPGFQPQNRGGQIGIIQQDILMRAATVYQQAAARNIATLQALERTIDGLSAVRGRKAVLMLSPGFIADQERMEAKRAIDAARRANVAVYFVDARGLVASTVYSQAQQGGRPLDSRDVGAANAEITLGAEGAAEIAQNTGGFSVRNQNDLGRGLQRIGAESRVYYLLGFQPDRSRQGRLLPPARGEGDAARRHGARPAWLLRGRRGARAPQPRAVPCRRASATASTRSIAPPSRPTSWVRFRSVLPTSPSARRATDSAVVMLVMEADLRAFGFAKGGGKLSDVLDLRVLTTELGDERHRALRAQGRDVVPRGDALRRRVVASAVAGVPSEAGPLPGARRGARRQQRPHRQRHARLRGAGADRLRLTTPILTDAIEAPSFGSQAPPKPVLIVRRAFPAGATLYYQFSVLGAGKDAAGATRVVGSHQSDRTGRGRRQAAGAAAGPAAAPRRAVSPASASRPAGRRLRAGAEGDGRGQPGSPWSAASRCPILPSQPAPASAGRQP